MNENDYEICVSVLRADPNCSCKNFGVVIPNGYGNND